MSNKYLYNVVAKTGDSVTAGGSLTSFADTTSINDPGQVAFIGKYGNVQDLLVGDGFNPIQNLSSDFSGSNFSAGVEINNNNQVVAVDRGGGISAVRLWDANSPGSFSRNFATGRFPPDNVDFENIFAFPSLNNNLPVGQAVFSATPKGAFPSIALATLAGDSGFLGGRSYNQAILASNGGVKPAISDNGLIVARDPVSRIVLQDYQLNIIDVIASGFSGFSSVGLASGISNDGNAVVFYGNYSGTGDNPYPGLELGPGIFASIKTDAGRIIHRIAGIAGNGILDPGEKFEDNNNDGIVAPGEDTGLVGGFAADERLGVSFKQTNDGGYGTVAYLAKDQFGQEALFQSQFNLSSSATEPTITTSLVALVGQQANEVASELTGNIQDINIYDPVNDKGQIAFWLQTTTSSEAVVQANPVRKPVLLLPGIGGSFPENADFREWLLNRGVQPNTLRPDPLLRTYDDLIETLKRAGYREGVDLFVAPYDWRLNPGPIDGSIDGKINRSAAELTDNTYEYAVDQLGFWLEEAVKGWRGQFAGLPDSEIPALDSVDIIAHSTGGLVARTYIQSTAYDEPSFEYQDHSGNTIQANLPKVDNLIMVGVPNRGASLAWNPLNNNIFVPNNFIESISTFFLGLIARAAYWKVREGATVAFNGNPNSPLAIQSSTNLDPVDFIGRYAPTLRSLLATYKFIDTLPNDGVYDASAESVAFSQKNTFLLDLNDGFDSQASINLIPPPDPNLFADKIRQATVIYGTNHAETPDAVTQRDQPDLLVNAGPIRIPIPTVFPIDTPLPVPIVPNGIWYKNELGGVADNVNAQGDGTVPLSSAVGQFGFNERPNIQLQPFTRNDEQNPGNTDDSVKHTKLMHNTDVQKLILETLNANLDEDLISTGLAKPSPSDLASAGGNTILRNIPFGNIFLDPVEGFLIDRQGRRLGYSQATGPVTEIPNSFWLGETDGIGWIDGLVEGPVKLQLTGIGEEYLVSVAVETTDGPAVIEAQGFLAAGEQQTFNIPVNNAPILDLNTSTEGIDSSMSLTLPQQTVAITDTDLQITDSESTNLQGATVTITNPLDGSLESLNATATGNITVAYDPATSTLTLSGADTIASYQQVLSTVTYTNTAANPNLTSREIAFMINDGASFNNFSPVATTTLTLTTSTSTPTQNLNLTGTSSDDTLVGDSGDDTLSGLEGNDNLDGKAGNDYLDGGEGNDTMIGGEGNDTYIVDSTSDVVSETSTIATETDTVLAATSYTLGANVENLTLTGTSAINATGNNLNNIITGNSGNNIVDGGAGDDTLIGSAGNDTYIVDSSGDVVSETSDIATEIDTVSAAINYTLGANLENLTLTGTASINGTGNNLNNTLSGNSGSNILDGGAGNDTLNGGTGNDTLIGGAGNDTYVVDTTSDVITESSTLATEIDRVQASVSWALGNNLENLTLTTGANINGTGNSLNNTITGNSGSNVLDGGTGNDTLIGGTGNDTYIVDSTSDVISEGSNTATEIDTVQASVSWTLANNLENLTLTGAANINATGNNLNNTITGNSGNNVLDGSTGNDTLIGGTGNDTYVVDSTSDAIAETSTIATEIDTVQASISWALANNLENLTLTGTANINGTGNSLNNTIAGNSGNNILNGGTGNDTLIGGTGNDTYIVDSTSDAIVEISTIATEIDTVSAATSYTLGANLENLTLTGTSAINGTGNSSSNTITGNSGNNILDGGAGNDNLIGGAGNDIYIVDSNSDVVTETSAIATEIDTVSATTSYTLGANVENLTLTGTANINGTGNSLNNTLAGNSGNNVLDGGAGNDTLIGNAGNDTLTGGGGSDRLLYDTNAAFTSSAVGLDLVTDFTIGTDKFVLDKTTFTALTSAAGNGFSISSEFAVVANNAAVGSSGALIVYSSATGNLFYNQDGAVAGLGSGGQFASLSRIPSLTASDFIIQA